jgi:hypothetical protein
VNSTRVSLEDILVEFGEVARARSTRIARGDILVEVRTG